jgi:hypothetical protein
VSILDDVSKTRRLAHEIACRAKAVCVDCGGPLPDNYTGTHCVDCRVNSGEVECGHCNNAGPSYFVQRCPGCTGLRG